MVPAQAPLPTDCRLRFHPLSGSQTSILISESLTGVMVAATRQNAARFRNADPCWPFPPARSGGVKAPAATGSAMVMVVLLSFRAVRLSHAGAPNTGAVAIAAIVNENLIGLVMADGSILAYYHALCGGGPDLRPARPSLP